ncbi:MAG: aldolase/citrate lyase family protein [Alphaproteobacteria bacterium]|nr:aldolase/citrate lyase family protein [Alphaproteobacteria bacterium]
MLTLINPARERLESGNISIGIGIRLVRTNEIAPLMKTAGMDWLFIDLEHGPLTLDQTAQISVTSLASGIAPIVRVPRGEMAMATRALDGGALGIVNPMCESASEARDIVAKLHYPPEGQRSVVGGLPQYNFRSPSIADSIEKMNKAMLVIVMLETPHAIAHSDEIAAVEGIDIIMIGTNDLAASSGIPGQVGHERISEYYKMVAKACKKHGKWMGMGGVPQPELQEKYINMGARFLLAGQDLTYLLGAATTTVDRVNTYL